AGYGRPSSPTRETSADTACSRSRYHAYPPRGWPATTDAASASASGRCPSAAATSAAPASYPWLVRPVRNADASSALNTFTGIAVPTSAAAGRLVVISTL